MKRLTFLLLIAALILPSAATFAQDPPPHPAIPPVPAFGECDLLYWSDDFSQRLDTLQSLDDFGNLVLHVGQSLVDCGEEWLAMIPTLLFGVPQDDFTPPEPVIADDGILTAEEAEIAITAAFNGDATLANRHLCEEEQLTEAAELTTWPEGSGFENLKCDRTGNIMVCEAELPFHDEALPIIMRFKIIDEKLCGEDIE